MATSAITAWVNWLRSDGQNPCPDKLTCIIRAISWVESRHGHGSGFNPTRDPMQVANPSDAAWLNIGKNPSNALDQRPVRQGTLTGYSWKDIPNNAPAMTGVNPTFLPATGSNDPNFTKQMSYYWGVIWYFYSLQQVMPEGQRGAWRLGNCDTNLLINGAIQYNGGGDPNYGQKIRDALKLVCCSSLFGL